VGSGETKKHFAGGVNLEGVHPWLFRVLTECLFLSFPHPVASALEAPQLCFASEGNPSNIAGIVSIAVEWSTSAIPPFYQHHYHQCNDIPLTLLAFLTMKTVQV